MKKDEYIGILTSGGDASGMNAAIRAVTRAAIFNGFKVKGIYRGYEGLIAGEVKELTTEDVSSIIQRGGTILKTARSETFITPEGRKKAYEIIQKENINALIIIGGDGSLTGARIFAEEYDVTCIGLPGTIDNDLYGTDFTIGYDVRVSILGHLQRGGAPSANDRILASRLGEAAIQALMEGQRNVMIGIRNNEIVYVPFVQAIKKDKPIDKSLIRVLNELSI